MLSPGELALPVLAAVGGGAVNAVAGGGTLLTFPSLLAAGVSPVSANATSTFSLVPGALSAFYGYRREVGGDGRVLLALAVPSVVGGYIGATLAVHSSDALFARLVPWLILGATVLFAAQDGLRRRFASGRGPVEGARDHALRMAALQLPVAIYGGYFGAGLGILMLAVLGLAGETHLHRMNALKNLVGACINAVGVLTFIAAGRVQFAFALPMAVGAIVGGLLGARLARVVGVARVRVLVVAVGVGMSAWMLLRSMSAP